MKLFKKELVPVPQDHPLYSSADGIFKIPATGAPLKMVTNGARILMLHSAVDASRYWQTRDYLVKALPPSNSEAASRCLSA